MIPEDRVPPSGWCSYVLRRTGMAPVRFDGRCIAYHFNNVVGGKCVPRWYDVAVYHRSATEGGGWVLECVYQSTWKGELSQSFVDVAMTREDMGRKLLALGPAHALRGIGYPPGAQFTERQRRMLDTLEVIRLSRISDVLQSLGASVTMG
jgi:hypothetical protein